MAATIPFHKGALKKIRDILYVQLATELPQDYAERLASALADQIADEMNGLVYIPKRNRLHARNATMLKQYQAGARAEDLKSQYGLSKARVYNILAKERAKIQS